MSLLFLLILVPFLADGKMTPTELARRQLEVKAKMIQQLNDKYHKHDVIATHDNLAAHLNAVSDGLSAHTEKHESQHQLNTNTHKLIKALFTRVKVLEKRKSTAVRSYVTVAVSSMIMTTAIILGLVTLRKKVTSSSK